MAKRKEGAIDPTRILWEHSTNKEGLHPVKIRVTQYKTTRYYPVMTPDKKKVFLSEPDYKHIEVTSKQKLRNKNRELKTIFEKEQERASKAITLATNQNTKPFSFAEFERHYLGADAKRNFLSFFKSHIDKLERKGQAGTVRAYSSAYSAFKDFQNGRDLDPADLSVQKLDAFDEWLREPRLKKSGKKSKPLNDTSVSIYMRCLRSIYNELAATDEYLETVYPFSRKRGDKKYEIISGSGQKGKTLTKEEIQSFINGKVEGEMIPENPMYRAKQLFLFSFFSGGANFKDLALLKYENVGKETIEFERQKTIRTKKDGRKVTMPLTDELQEILIEQGNPDRKKVNYVFAVFDATQKNTPKEIDDTIRQWVKTTNKWLKRYCALNDLPEVSTYSARHTFASISKSHLPLAMISAMLGHSRITTTQTYLGRFENEENKAGLMKVFGEIKKKQA